MAKKKKVKGWVKAVINGEILLKLGLDRYLPHMLVAFLCFAVVIYAKIRIDDVMIELERSTSELETVRIMHAQKTCEYVGLEKLGAIEELIEEKGLEIGMPDKPAGTIRK